MAFELEQREALHLLEAIENGQKSSIEIGHLMDEADPALIYLIVTWLRTRYGANHPASEGVIGRIVDTIKGHRSMNQKMTEGKNDPISRWFEEEYEYREFDSGAFIALIVEKLES